MSDPCPLCAAPTRLAYTDYPGYRAPKRFDILACDCCELSFALPLEPDDQLYDVIYRNINLVPGYDRYAQYARAVLQTRDPLALLGRAEDMYWAVKSLVDERGPKALGRTLEIGSGLGYLTYALAQAGVAARGVDLASEAVAGARARYTDLFDLIEPGGLERMRAGHYDTIVMLEVIEHVADPVALLKAVFRLLRDGGRLLVSTPNRSFYPPRTVWETDAPPVHLWWFSERALGMLAQQLGLRIEFVDFTAYSLSAPPANDPRAYRSSGHPSPVIDENDSVCIRTPLAKQLLMRLGLYLGAKHVEGRLMRAARLHRLRLFNNGSFNLRRRETLAAILEKPVR